MLKIDYYKYASNGNNFVVIDEINDEKIPEVNKALCAKYIAESVSGIGCDSVIFLQKYDTKILNQIYSKKINYNYNLPPEFIMRIYEKGTESNMCGNGLICAGHHLALKHGVMNARIATEMPTFTPVVREVIHHKTVTKAILGNASVPPACFVNTLAFAAEEKNYFHIKDFSITIHIEEENYNFIINGYITFTGEPHLVFFKQNNSAELFRTIFESIELLCRPEINSVLIDQIGFKFNQYLDYFPKGININFANIVSKDTIINRCFERGINAETYACGTGAAAVAFMAHQLGLISSDNISILPWKARQHDLYKDARIEVSKLYDKYSIAAHFVLLSEGKYYFPFASYPRMDFLGG